MLDIVGRRTLVDGRFGAPLPIRFAVLGMLLVALTGAAQATTLHYGAYLAGIQVGEGRVEIRLDADRYRIDGHAAALGLLRAATQWQSAFSATGAIEAGAVVPHTYHYATTRRGDRSRTTRIVHGVVDTFSNGRHRRTLEAPDALDVLSALFFPGECATLDVAHTGTSTYRLTLRQHEVSATPAQSHYVERCAFDVVDDEGNRHQIDVRMGEVNGHRFPVRIDVGGVVTGTVRLIDEPQTTAAAQFAQRRTHQASD
jgi:hypothetical protein